MLFEVPVSLGWLYVTASEPGPLEQHQKSIEPTQADTVLGVVTRGPPAAPGRPLPRHERWAGLDLISKQIRLMREVSQVQPAGARWLLKEAIFWLWEAPKINHQTLRRGKYSLHVPWSPRAYERVASWRSGMKLPSTEGLRLEHLIPRAIVAEHLLNTKDLPDLAPFLNRYFQAVVVAKKDDQELNQVGLRSKWPKDWKRSDSLWLRYSVAAARYGLGKLDPAGFKVPVREDTDLVQYLRTKSGRG